MGVSTDEATLSQLDMEFLVRPATQLCGHGRKEIAAAVAAQLEALDFSLIHFGMSHSPGIRLAERIAGLTPGGLDHIHFATNGSGANEPAFKTARYYWR